MGSSVQDLHLTMNSYSVVLGALLVVGQVKGECQSPGNAMCYDATAGAVTGSCCSGSQCQPYIPSGTTPTGAVDWYCQYLNKLALGESCANKVGSCDTNLNCIDGVCSDQATTTSSDTTTASSDTTTVSSDTTTASSDTTTADATTTTSSDATTAASSDTTTAAADTTTASTDCAAGGQVCKYTSQYTNITMDCCSPYTCTSATSQSSICTGDNLSEGT